MELSKKDMRFRMRIGGMTCESCEHHVQQALHDAGARDVTADYRRGEALFVVNGPAEVGLFADAVGKVGYTPGQLEPVDIVPRREAGAAVEPAANILVDAMARTSHRVRAIEHVTYERADQPPAKRGSANRFDLAIVGSGGGAFAAAIAASERGARVVMLERGTLGGTCVNVGCIPSKTQLHAAELFWQAGHHGFGGVRTEAVSVDMPELVAQKDELVGKLRHEKY